MTAEPSMEEAVSNHQAAVAFHFNDHKQNSESMYNFHSKPWFS